MSTSESWCNVSVQRTHLLITLQIRKNHVHENNHAHDMSTQPYKLHSSGYKTYSDRFKAECVAKCVEGNLSVSSVAVKHGMNPNVLHRWIKEHKSTGRHDLSSFEDKPYDAAREISAPNRNNWLAMLPEGGHSVPVPKEHALPKKAPINIGHDSVSLEISSDKLSLKLNWPGASPAGLAQFIKDLMA